MDRARITIRSFWWRSFNLGLQHLKEFVDVWVMHLIQFLEVRMSELLWSAVIRLQDYLWQKSILQSSSKQCCFCCVNWINNCWYSLTTAGWQKFLFEKKRKNKIWTCHLKGNMIVMQFVLRLIYFCLIQHLFWNTLKLFSWEVKKYTTSSFDLWLWQIREVLQHCNTMQCKKIYLFFFSSERVVKRWNRQPGK